MRSERCNLGRKILPVIEAEALVLPVSVRIVIIAGIQHFEWDSLQKRGNSLLDFPFS